MPWNWNDPWTQIVAAAVVLAALMLLARRSPTRRSGRPDTETGDIDAVMERASVTDAPFGRSIPPGSQLRYARDGEMHIFRLPASRTALAAALFPMIWLAGWTVGILFAAGILILTIMGESGGGLFVVVFLSIWLFIAVIAEIAMLLFLFQQMATAFGTRYLMISVERISVVYLLLGFRRRTGIDAAEIDRARGDDNGVVLVRDPHPFSVSGMTAEESRLVADVINEVLKRPSE